MATAAKKTFDMVPSTGGSDESLPKPHSSSAGSKNAQTTTSAETSRSGGKDVKSPLEMFNVNFNVVGIQHVNPLKDFEPAKFASKTHGLITSYSANTH